jgi:hypothetical protein
VRGYSTCASAGMPSGAVAYLKASSATCWVPRMPRFVFRGAQLKLFFPTHMAEARVCLADISGDGLARNILAIPGSN